MTGHEGQPEEAAEADAQEHELPFWLQATPDDIAGLEFEAPIIGCNSADCVELSTLYRKEATELQEAQGNQAAAKVSRCCPPVRTFISNLMIATHPSAR